jgi:hypothetical protein
MKIILAVWIALSICGMHAFGASPLACACPDTADVCLADRQMSEHTQHVEMAADQMGHHVNLKGVAVVQVEIDETGRLVSAKGLSGNPLAINLLIGAVKAWRFESYLRDGIARKACGRVTIRYSVIENIPSAQVLK